MKNSRHYASVFVLIVLATIGLYFLFSAMFRLPTAASAEAGPIDNMMHVHFWVIAFLFALIMVIMLYAAFAFRRQPGDETDAPHIHGNYALEIAWTVLPTITVIGFGIWAVGVFNDLIRPNPDEMVISVTSQQWSWSFQYPEQDEIRSSILTLPVNQPVVLEMQSQDVIHSFWVPEFRVKQDLVPGQMTHLRFTPTLPGTYKVRCAEICGTGHAKMLATVEVVSQDEFIAWVEEIKSKPDPTTIEVAAERGAIWASTDYFSCVGCHSADGTPLAGPTWQGIYGTEEELADGSTVIVDDEYIHTSIVEPNAQIVAGFSPNIMPATLDEQIAAVQETISNEDIDIIDDITAYIESLGE
jgi:cytochrome c oxidase subunit 2